MSGFPSRYVGLSEARFRFGDRVDRLGRFLTRVDEPADAVIDAIESMPKGEGWRVFDEAIKRGPSAEMPEPMRALVSRAAEVPVWVDWPTCERGGAMLMRAGPLGGAVLGARSLVLGYASPAGNKPLVMSGRLKEQAPRRLNETARFVQAVCRPGGMRPFADGWQITMKVRLIHAQVRRMILKSGKWHGDDWGQPVNQHDMAGTTLLFSITIIEGLRKLGMHISHAESESYIHLWRWVGRVIGVDEDVLPASEAEALRLAALIAATMGAPDQDSRDLTKALFDASREVAHTTKQKLEAERNIMFGLAIARELAGEELSDQLAIAKSPFSYAMPMMKRFVSGLGSVIKRVPYGEKNATSIGMRYWDRVVEVGLEDATYEFGLPERLGALHAFRVRRQRERVAVP